MLIIFLITYIITTLLAKTYIFLSIYIFKQILCASISFPYSFMLFKITLIIITHYIKKNQIPKGKYCFFLFNSTQPNYQISV